MNDTTIVVGTFGDAKWADLARTRAIPSATAETDHVIHVHGDTLHEARNEGLRQVTTPRVVVLDADDELEPGYLDAMSTGTADVRAPAVRYVHSARQRTRAAMPRVAGHTHACTADCLAYGNWLVIGSSAPTELLLRVGGFEDFAMFEDWAAWVRCWQADATFEAIPAAVYRAFVRRDSRNREPSRAAKLAAHQQIAVALGLPVPPSPAYADTY